MRIVIIKMGHYTAEPDGLVTYAYDAEMLNPGWGTISCPQQIPLARQESFGYPNLA